NLTQDHLDYHQTLDAYFDAKLRLFREYPAMTSKRFTASVNLDDPRGPKVVAATKGTVLTYAVNAEADVRATDVDLQPSSLKFSVLLAKGGCFPISLRMGGAFQVYTALAATAAGIGVGIPIEAIQDGLDSLTSVPGRLESVPTRRGFHLVVDYAHTPD